MIYSESALKLGHAFERSFLSFGQVQSGRISNGNLLTFVLFMENMGHDFHAKTFSILDTVGMIGGVFEVLLFLFGLLMFPLSEHSFYLNAGKRLYFARTANPNLLNKNRKGEEEILEEYKLTEEEA